MFIVTNYLNAIGNRYSRIKGLNIILLSYLSYKYYIVEMFVCFFLFVCWNGNFLFFDGPLTEECYIL